MKFSEVCCETMGCLISFSSSGCSTRHKGSMVYCGAQANIAMGFEQLGMEQHWVHDITMIGAVMGPPALAGRVCPQ
jgi:hypothetical protein